MIWNGGMAMYSDEKFIANRQLWGVMSQSIMITPYTLQFSQY